MTDLKTRTYSDLFFSSAFEEVSNHSLLSNEFVIYLTARVIMSSPELIWNLDRLFDAVSLYYPSGSMKAGNFKIEVKKYFSKGDISNKQKQLIYYSESMQAMISQMISEGDKSTYEKLLSLIKNKKISNELFCSIMALDDIKTGNAIDYYGYLS